MCAVGGNRNYKEERNRKGRKASVIVGLEQEERDRNNHDLSWQEWKRWRPALLLPDDDGEVDVVADAIASTSTSARNREIHNRANVE